MFSGVEKSPPTHGDGSNKQTKIVEIKYVNFYLEF